MVTASTRFGWMKFRECGEFLYGKSCQWWWKEGPFGHVWDRLCYTEVRHGVWERMNEMSILRRTERAMVRSMCVANLMDKKNTNKLMNILGENVENLAKTSRMLWYQGRNEVRWRLGQETSLAPPYSNLSSFGRKFTVMKKVLLKLLGLFGPISRHLAPPAVIRRFQNDPAIQLPGNRALLFPPSIRRSMVRTCFSHRWGWCPKKDAASRWRVRENWEDHGRQGGGK